MVSVTEPTEQEKKQVGLYVVLMHEITIRLDVILYIFHNYPKFPILLVREMCYQQFRYLCELVAIGCLVAHGTTSKRLIGTYEASKIIKEMAKLKPDFYPVPIQITSVEMSSGVRAHTIVEKHESDHLTKEDLANLWKTSGDLMHRTPLKKLVDINAADPADLSHVTSFLQKFVGLLNSHRIRLSETRGLIVHMKMADTGLPLAQFLDWSSGEIALHTIKGLPPQKL
jgi:hypothetical protein